MAMCYVAAANAESGSKKMASYDPSCGETNNFTFGSYTPSRSDFAASRESRMPGH